MIRLNLDACEVVDAHVAFDPETGLVRISGVDGTYPVSPLIWISVFLRWAKKYRARTVHLLRDHQDGVIRQLIHYEAEENKLKWYEALPVPWDWANKAFDDLSDKLEVADNGVQSSLVYTWNSNRGVISCALKSQNDLVFYFTNDRPRIPRLNEPFPA